MNQESEKILATGVHEYLAQDRVIWGVPAAQAVLEESDLMLIAYNYIHRTL